MDHLLHPWHYWPLILALPYIGVWALYLKQRLYGADHARREEKAESHRRLD